jgi:hypothetical protein
MASLTGTKIKDTYDSLLKVSDNGALDGTLQTITDGLGNNSALSLSTAGASVGGTLSVSGAATFSGGVSGNVAFDTNTLFVDAANNRVGVGTNPSVLLDIAQSGTPIFQITDLQSGGKYFFIGVDTNNTFLRTNGNMSFQNGSANEVMRIHSGGDVSFRDSSANEAFYWDASAASLGIGTASPEGSLSVVATGTYALSLDNSASDTIINLRKSSAQKGYILAGASDIDVFAVNNLKFLTGGSATERIRIDSSGNVGIGTPSPSRNLHILGGAGIGTVLKLEAGSGATTYLQLAYNGATNAQSGYISYDPSANMGLFTNDTERMRIDASGNVGIGTNSPDTKVHISATSGATLTLGMSGGISAGTEYSSLQFQADSYGFIPAEIKAINTNGGANFGVLTFETSGTERMRITSGGYLKASNDSTYLGSTATYHELRSNAAAHSLVLTNSHASTPYGLSIVFTGSDPNNTTQNFVDFVGSTTSRFIVYSNGNVVNTNNSYGAISDAKLKENVVDASPKLEDLMQVQVRNFNYIGDDKKQLGVVAQELEEVFPSMIDESPDYEERDVEVRDEEGNIVYKTEQVLVSEAVLDEEGNVVEEAVYETSVTDEPEMTKEKVDLGTVTKSVKYSVFVPMLIKAIQELNAKVESLEAQLNA